MSHTFQVDLRGVVDLLSHHLYASQRVFVRELLQNAVDAISARRLVEPTCPARILIEPTESTGDGTLRVTDTGIGLTEEQMYELLATIGRSSKRDELGFARHDFLGQFGIGLLSCFMVADSIRVESRAADARTVCWVGNSDGSYEVSNPTRERSEIGTTVTLIPRRDAGTWLSRKTVVELARLYGSLLPFSISVGNVDVSTGVLPWLRVTGTPAAAHREQLNEYAREIFGFTPFDVIDIAVPAAGLSGVAFVLPTPTNPAAKAGHRVYLKRMLLAEGAQDLLPEWAFFARCVIDATELRPTASREALYSDSLLEAVREQIGEQLRDWLVKLATRDPRKLVAFLEIHHLGVKALALHDDEMLGLVERWWPMETTEGRLTLAEFRQRHGVVRYTARNDEFRQLGSVAAAAGLPMVNAGYTYDVEIIERLPLVQSGVLIELLEPSDLMTRFQALEPETELAVRPFLSVAQHAVDRLGCEVVLRSFDPAGLPALYLVNRSAVFAEQLQDTKDRVDEVWADVLDALADSTVDDRCQLVLNHRNPLVRRATEVRDPAVLRLAVEALYCQALLLGHHPIRPADAALLNTSFLGLLNRAIPEPPEPCEPDEEEPPQGSSGGADLPEPPQGSSGGADLPEPPQGSESAQ